MWRCRGILGARGFSHAISDLGQAIFGRSFSARVFGLRPNTCRPAADETKNRDARAKKSLVPRVF